MVFQPIGFLRTPYKEISDMPIQPSGARGVFGHIELNPELVDGLTDLDGFFARHRPVSLSSDYRCTFAC